MNNGNSFHNGPANLELQNRTLKGAEPPSIDTPPAATEPAVTAEATHDTVMTNGEAPASAPTAEPVKAAESIPAATASPVGIPHYDPAPVYSPYQFDNGETDQSNRAEKFNLASLILGIASFAGNLCCLTCLTPFSAILAIIFGCMGRIEGRFRAKGLAGMILGIAYLALILLMLLYIVAVAVLMGDTFETMVNEAMTGVPLS